MGMEPDTVSDPMAHALQATCDIITYLDHIFAMTGSIERKLFFTYEQQDAREAFLPLHKGTPTNHFTPFP